MKNLTKYKLNKRNNSHTCKLPLLNAFQNEIGDILSSRIYYPSFTAKAGNSQYELWII